MLLSTPAIVTSGVPQGTVFGPLLFDIFVNDAPLCITSSKCIMYADDTRLYNTVMNTNDCTDLQDSLELFSKWCNLWQLRLNVKKCAVLRIHQKSVAPILFHYNINGAVLSSVTEFCDLGVLVDNHLTFVHHISNIISRAKRVSGIIYNVFKTRSITFLLKMYKTFVRPILEFNTCIWSPHLLHLINSIESVQRNFTCRIPAVCNLNYPDRLVALELESLEQRRLLIDCKWLYRLLYCSHEPSHFSHFIHNPNVHLRGHNVKLITQFTYNTVVKNCFFYRVIPLWNSLNFCPSRCSSLNDFICKLYMHDFVHHLRGRALV